MKLKSLLYFNSWWSKLLNCSANTQIREFRKLDRKNETFTCGSDSSQPRPELPAPPWTPSPAQNSRPRPELPALHWTPSPAQNSQPRPELPAPPWTPGPAQNSQPILVAVSWGVVGASCEDIFTLVKTTLGLCSTFVRGSATSFSLHSLS